MNNDGEIFCNRVTYREGQLFTARDMEDDRRREAWLRRLHMRYLHDTWGIALGFEVDKTNDNMSVRLKPGYAVDDQGRGLLQAETIQLPVPEVVGPESFVATLSYQEDAAFREVPAPVPLPQRQQVCSGTVKPFDTSIAVNAVIML